METPIPTGAVWRLPPPGSPPYLHRCISYGRQPGQSHLSPHIAPTHAAKRCPKATREKSQNPKLGASLPGPEWQRGAFWHGRPWARTGPWADGWTTASGVYPLHTPVLGHPHAHSRGRSKEGMRDTHHGHPPQGAPGLSLAMAAVLGGELRVPVVTMGIPLAPCLPTPASEECGPPPRIQVSVFLLECSPTASSGAEAWVPLFPTAEGPCVWPPEAGWSGRQLGSSRRRASEEVGWGLPRIRCSLVLAKLLYVTRARPGNREPGWGLVTGVATAT